VARPPSEIALALLLFHRGRLVAIDEPALALGAPRRGELGDEGGERLGVAFRRRRKRVATEGPEPHLSHLGLFAGLEDEALVVRHDPLRAALHHGALAREVERHDRDLLAADVVPDVELGPVGEREHADRFARPDPRVVEIPELGALRLRVPAMAGTTNGEDALLRARLLLVAPRAAED